MFGRTCLGLLIFDLLSRTNKQPRASRNAAYPPMAWQQQLQPLKSRHWFAPAFTPSVFLRLPGHWLRGNYLELHKGSNSYHSRDLTTWGPAIPVTRCYRWLHLSVSCPSLSFLYPGVFLPFSVFSVSQASKTIPCPVNKSFSWDMGRKYVNIYSCSWRRSGYTFASGSGKSCFTVYVHNIGERSPAHRPCSRWSVAIMLLVLVF